MKCLSVKQPYAELIVSGRKTIELRTWNPSFRGEFLVHASGEPDVEACELLGMKREALINGALVGKATIYAVVTYNTDEQLLHDRRKHFGTEHYCKAPRYGFLLKNAKRFEKPISMPGKLGFFDVDAKALL